MVPNQTTRRAHLGHLVGLTSGHEENPDANHGAGRKNRGKPKKWPSHVGK